MFEIFSSSGGLSQPHKKAKKRKLWFGLGGGGGGGVGFL